MKQILETIVSDYDRGRLTRRELVSRLGGLVALAAGASTLSAGASTLSAGPRTFAAESRTSASTFRAVGLNHIALTVADIKRSRDFYVSHLGLTVERESRGSCFLTAGDNFVALFRGSQPGLHHYCYSVENYSAEDAAARLGKQGIAPRIADGRIYFDDPDGLEVQLAAPDHRPHDAS